MTDGKGKNAMRRVGRLDPGGAKPHREGVKTPPPKPDSSEAARREARRAQALRANLRRRKAPPAPPPADIDPPCDSRPPG